MGIIEENVERLGDGEGEEEEDEERIEKEGMKEETMQERERYS